MGYSIQRATVIGAGTMGAGIAAHLANAGILVYLIDIVPGELNDEEKAHGLTLKHQAVRNRMGQEGLMRLQKTHTPIFFTTRFVERITIGNLEDNFEWVGQSDWIIEAVVENLEVKQNLFSRIEKSRRAGSIITTNTSGLVLREISSGLSEDFRKHFLGTHFFNPPYIMRLLEIIPGSQTNPEVLDFMIRFAENVLGKRVVVCRDTPNFIANRLGVMQASFDLEYIISQGFTVEEADAVLGLLVGRPTTAFFRLRDLVGLDVSIQVINNLYQSIPYDDFREILKAQHAQALREAMLQRGWLGRKAGQGFYREIGRAEGERQFLVLDLEKLEYREPQKPDLIGLEEAQQINSLEERLRFLINQENRLGKLVWATHKNALAYAAYCLPEIAGNVVSMDRAMRWGYSWELGPFQIWDILGVADTVTRIENDGQQVAKWVHEMLELGFSSFYKFENGDQFYYDDKFKDYVQLSSDPRIISLSKIKVNDKKVIISNPSASLIDLGDGVACLEFHTKANALDDYIVEMMDLALQEVKRNFLGLVIGNEGKHFSAGANLQWLLKRAKDGRFDEIESRLSRSQKLRMDMRYFSKPVVAACFGMTLGGGAETVMAASKVCADSKSHIGLVEAGVGLIPGGGGCKELLRRVVSQPMRTPDVDPMAFIKQIHEYISKGIVSNSAADAIDMGFLSESDQIVMNRDHLLAHAKHQVMAMVTAKFQPPVQEKSIFVVGQSGKAVLEHVIYQQKKAGQIQEHDAVVSNKIAHILCGGNLTSSQWVDEQYILDLEREAFCSLCSEPNTQARIEHFLVTGQKLRN